MSLSIISECCIITEYCTMPYTREIILGLWNFLILNCLTLLLILMNRKTIDATFQD